MYLMQRRAWSWMLLSATVLSVSAPLNALGDTGADISRAERRELWVRNISTLQGQRSGASAPAIMLDAGALPDDPRVKQWIKEYRETLDFLAKAKLDDYNKYVEWGRKHLEKKQIREALFETNKAHSTAADGEALLKSDWVNQLAVAAADKASDHREAGEWMKAWWIYSRLTNLFEDEKQYDKARHECLTHARLDSMYAADTKWAEHLEDVDVRNVIDALERIKRFYVTKPDFQEITRSGLEQLLLLADSEVMRETLAGLDDDELREEYVRRLGTRLDQVRKSSGLTAGDSKRHFRRAVKINAQTVRLPEEVIIYEFMVGALEPLDDFTSMIWPVESREFEKHTRGDFIGVGISISGGNQNPISVVSPLEDTPAYRAGIQAGDHITHVNGESLEGVSLTKAVRTITGPIDTEVTLTIYRSSTQRSMDFTLKRSLVKIRSVKGLTRNVDSPEDWNHMLDEDQRIAYVRVTSFQENSVDDLRDVVDDLLADGVKGLILDLRFNPGGLLKSAVEMAQLFLGRDDLVVSTQGLHDERWENPKPPHDGPYTSLPLVVLVNVHSASASEIVSGALQDHKRAIIIGERTFGKFSVQKLMTLGGGETHLKLTTARYYLPSGRNLHHDEGATEWGVMPDVEVKTVFKENARIREMRRTSDVLARASSTEELPDSPDGQNAQTADDDDGDAQKPNEGGDADSEPGEDDLESDDDAEEQEDDDALDLAPDPNELPDIDAQLDTALLLMRLHLLEESALRVAVGRTADEESKETRNP